MDRQSCLSGVVVVVPSQLYAAPGFEARTLICVMWIIQRLDAGPRMHGRFGIGR